MLLNFIEKSISKIPNLPFSLFFLFLPHFSQSHFAHKTTKNCRRKNLICSTPNLSTPPICNIIEFTKKHDLRFDLDDLTAIEQPQKITLLIKMKEKKKRNPIRSQFHTECLNRKIPFELLGSYLDVANDRSSRLRYVRRNSNLHPAIYAIVLPLDSKSPRNRRNSFDDLVNCLYRTLIIKGWLMEKGDR